MNLKIVLFLTILVAVVYPGTSITAVDLVKSTEDTHDDTLASQAVAESLTGLSLPNFEKQEKKYYTGIGFGISHLQPLIPDGSPNTLSQDTGVSGQLTMGFNLSSRTSAELHVSDLGSSKFRPSGKIHYSIYGASGVFKILKKGLPLYSTTLNGFVRAGYARLNANISDDVQARAKTENHSLIGGGLELNFTNNISARIELSSYAQDIKLAQTSPMYSFGQAKVPRVITVSNPVTIVNQAPAVKTAATKPIDGDLDNDQVPNTKDQCPNTAPGLAVDPFGCAIFAGVIQGVNFATGSATLTLNAKNVLRGVAKTLQSYPKTTLKVFAHTDSQGSDDYNQHLSLLRAKSVVDHLAKVGVARNRLSPSAFGESTPIASNSTSEGRAKNRRVELFAHGN